MNLIFITSINLAGEIYLFHEIFKCSAAEKLRKYAPYSGRPQLRHRKMAISVIQ